MRLFSRLAAIKLNKAKSFYWQMGILPLGDLCSGDDGPVSGWTL